MNNEGGNMNYTQKYKHYPFINTTIRKFEGRGVYALANESDVALYGLEPYSLNGYSVIRAFRHCPGPEELFFSDPAMLCIKGRVMGGRS